MQISYSHPKCPLVDWDLLEAIWVQETSTTDVKLILHGVLHMDQENSPVSVKM